MRQNAKTAIELMLKHEGGFVNHPNDPGGATNRGVTIGTLRRLGMDLDGDGDVDVTDLKQLSQADAVKVFKRFYWDKVEADALPSGVDYTVGDFAVNSGPSRAAKHLQRALGVTQDGAVGPITIQAAQEVDPVDLINSINDSRLKFMRSIKKGKLWATFGRGWQRRVDEVRAASLDMAGKQPIVDHAPAPPPSQPAQPQKNPSGGKGGLWAGIGALLVASGAAMATKGCEWFDWLLYYN